MKRYCGERETKITKERNFRSSVFKNLVYLKTSKEMNFIAWFPTLTTGYIKTLIVSGVSKITPDIYKRF